MSHIDPDALKYVLSIPRGRKVLWDLLAAAGLNHQPWRTDQRETDLNCGSLNVGLILFADCMTSSPELTAMMIQEQGNYDNARSDTSGDSGDSPAARPTSSRINLKPPVRDASTEPPSERLGFDRFSGAAGTSGIFGDEG